MSSSVRRYASYYLLAVYMAAAIGGGSWQYVPNWLSSLGKVSDVQPGESHSHEHWHCHAPDNVWHVHFVPKSDASDREDERLGTEDREDQESSISGDGWVHQPHACPWLGWVASMRLGSGGNASYFEADENVSQFDRFESDDIAATALFNVQARGPPCAGRQA